MQRSRTNLKLWLSILCVHLVHSSAALYNDSNDFQISRIAEITENLEEGDVMKTYQPVNEPTVINNEYFGERTYEIKAKSITGGDRPIQIISTLSHDSCDEKLTSLPAWKIKEIREGKFRVKIHWTKQLNGKYLFLCVFDETSGKYKHLGPNSLFGVHG